ncbi:hypothetical protein D9M68_817310 [compost metagenome]
MQLERRVVDQDVELAEGGDGGIHRLAAEGRVAHIATDREAARALGFDVAAGLLRVRFFIVEVHDGHVRAFACVEHGHRAADA